MIPLKVGQEIEYQIQLGKRRGKRWESHRGRVVQVTDRHIAIQTPKYPDSIPICDLVSGQAKITEPAMDFSGYRMERRAREEGAEQMNVKYDWDTFGPRVVAMMAKGRGIPEIARELDYPYHAVRDYVKRHVPTKKPSEDTCPAGREECPHPADILPGGGLLPNTTTMIAVDGEYQRRIFERFHQQRKKGIDKYGQPLEDNPAGMDERLEHLAQELTDGLMYIEWSKALSGEYGFREYAIAALRTAQQERGDRELLLNGVFGLVGEAGEVVDHLKKHLFQGHVLDSAHIADELGDVLWYVNLIAAACGCELDAIARGNIAKLQARYPGEGFDAQCSINRAEGTD